MTEETGGHVAHTGVTKNRHEVSARKPEENSPPEDLDTDGAVT